MASYTDPDEQLVQDFAADGRRLKLRQRRALMNSRADMVAISVKVPAAVKAQLTARAQAKAEAGKEGRYTERWSLSDEINAIFRQALED